MEPARYTRSQIAQLLHIAPKTLYNWEKEGKIAAPLRDARGWRRYTEEQFRDIRALVSPEILASAPGFRALPGEEVALQLSARNHLPGTVTSITSDGVTAEVVIDLGHGREIVAVITRGSVARLGLRIGDTAIAVIKATEVMIGK